MLPRSTPAGASLHMRGRHPSERPSLGHRGNPEAQLDNRTRCSDGATAACMAGMAQQGDRNRHYSDGATPAKLSSAQGRSCPSRGRTEEEAGHTGPQPSTVGQRRRHNRMGHSRGNSTSMDTGAASASTDTSRGISSSVGRTRGMSSGSVCRTRVMSSGSASAWMGGPCLGLALLLLLHATAPAEAFLQFGDPMPLPNTTVAASHSDGPGQGVTVSSEGSPTVTTAAPKRGDRITRWPLRLPLRVGPESATTGQPRGDASTNNSTTNGTIINTNGTTINTNGTTINTNGTTINTNGTNINTNGTTINTNGTTINTNGTNINTNSTTINTNGTSTPVTNSSSSGTNTTARLDGTTLVDGDLGHSAGYFKLKRTVDARLFYFFFRSRQGANNSDPLVLWLTGGPGCSSSLALFAENGPYAINPDNTTLSWNPNGWDKVSNIIFLDQPVGTGFSYTTNSTDYVTQIASVGVDLYDFLQDFLAAYPEMASRPFYLAGESYAGHYIPTFATKILEENARNASGAVRIPLKGVAVGNPWVDPVLQYRSLPDFGLNNKLMSTSSYASLVSAYNSTLLPALHSCSASANAGCPAAWKQGSIFFNKAWRAMGPGNLNYYDVRQACAFPASACYDFSRVSKFLALNATRQALGVPASFQWQQCSSQVYSSIYGQQAQSLAPAYATLLKAGIATFVYAGEYDFIANWLGNKRWVNALQWPGAAKFRAFNMRVMKLVRNVPSGEYYLYGKLSFFKMYKAGHLAPMDQPEVSLEMMRRFLTKGFL